MVCTYAFKNADGERQVITGKESFKAFLASGGLEQLQGMLPDGVKLSSERKELNVPDLIQNKMIDEYNSNINEDLPIGYTYDVLDQDQLESIYGDIEDMPQKVQDALKEGKLVIQYGDENDTEIQPEDKAPTEDEFTKESRRKEGLQGKASSLDDMLLDGSDMYAASAAFQIMAKSEGWNIDGRSNKYLTLTKNNSNGDTMHVYVRVSDHSRTAGGSRPMYANDININLAPSYGSGNEQFYADTFETALWKLRNAKINSNGDLMFGDKDATKLSSARNSIPLYKENKSIPQTIQQVSSQPNVALQSAKDLLTAGKPQSEMLESIVTNLFDSDNTLEQIARRTGKNGQKDAAAQKFLDTQKLYKAASQKVVSDAIKEYADPMLETLKDAWSSTYSKLPWYQENGYKQFLNDIGTIGNLVKHGKERNADIAAKTNGKDLAGSGRTNAEIDQIEKDIRQEAPGLIELYEKIYKANLKPMMDIANNAKRESGLLTPEMEAARKNYQWYVPLYGDPSEFEQQNIGTSGGGLKSPKDKKALGRSGTLADNVLENVLKQMSNSVTQAGKQQMKSDLIDWIKASPSAKLALGAKINDSSTSEIFEKYTGADGLVHERVKPGAAMSPTAMVYRNGNETTVVDFSNPKVVESLNGLKPIEGVLGGIQKSTRLMGAVFTRYNPIFPVMNKLRDSQSQISFVIADAPVKDKYKTAKDTLANNLKYSKEWGSRESQEYKDWKDKFQRLGGATMYSDVLHDDVMKNIERDFAVAVDNKLMANKLAKKIGNVVDAVNEHMEMSSRVAMFKALVDNGMTERQAALYTKNTMNFETKGKWGQQLGALYTFAGPALFDSRRMAQSLRTPRGAMVMAAQFAMMYGLYGALKAMGGDDEDGVAKLNKIPVNQSGRFLTFIGEDGTGYKIPVGFGYSRIALTLAASLHRYLDGVDDVGEFAQHAGIDGLISNFSVIEPKDINIKKDAIGWAMQTFLPTVTQPLYQVASNKNFQGAPIHKPDEWTGSKLQFEQAWPNTSKLFKDAAKDIYDATGIDIYPETLAHMLRSYGGNGVMDIVRGIQLMGEKADKDWTLSDVPAIQGFASRASSQDANRFRENYAELNKLFDVRKYEAKEGRLSEFDADHPTLARDLSIYKAADKEIKLLYTARKAADTNTIKEINKRIHSIQMRANKYTEES